MKTILLYALVIIGIPNFVGMVVAFPLGLILMPVARLLAPDAGLSHPLLSFLMGLCLGLGCGVTGILLTWLLAQTSNVALPIISSVWALIYYYSRGVDKLEGWAYVVGVFCAMGRFLDVAHMNSNAAQQIGYESRSQAQRSPLPPKS